MKKKAKTSKSDNTQKWPLSITWLLTVQWKQQLDQTHRAHTYNIYYNILYICTVLYTDI